MRPDANIEFRRVRGGREGGSRPPRLVDSADYDKTTSREALAYLIRVATSSPTTEASVSCFGRTSSTDACCAWRTT
jgi:hypothetical protein